MLSPARRHRLQALAAKEAAKADEFGGVRPDASVYQLQLTELKNFSQAQKLNRMKSLPPSCCGALTVVYSIKV